MKEGHYGCAPLAFYLFRSFIDFQIFGHYSALFASGFWFGDLFSTIWCFMHALCLNFARESISCLSTLSFFLGCLSIFVWPKDGREVWSWNHWHPVWFCRTCLRCLSFFCFVHTRIHTPMTSLIIVLVFMWSRPLQKWPDETNETLEWSDYPWSWRTGLRLLTGLIKAKKEMLGGWLIPPEN